MKRNTRKPAKKIEIKTDNDVNKALSEVLAESPTKPPQNKKKRDQGFSIHESEHRYHITFSRCSSIRSVLVDTEDGHHLTYTKDTVALAG